MPRCDARAGSSGYRECPAGAPVVVDASGCVATPPAIGSWCVLRAVGTSPPNCQISTFRMLTFGSRGSPATHPEGAAGMVSQCKINDIVRRAAQNTRRPFLRAWQSRISHVRRHGFGGRSGHLDEGCVDTTCHSSLARLCGTACRSPHSRQDYARLGLPVTTPTSPAGAYR